MMTYFSYCISNPLPESKDNLLTPLKILKTLILKNDKNTQKSQICYKNHVNTQFLFKPFKLKFSLEKKM